MVDTSRRFQCKPIKGIEVVSNWKILEINKLVPTITTSKGVDGLKSKEVPPHRTEDQQYEIVNK